MNLDDLRATGFIYNADYVEPAILAADGGGFCIQMTSTKDPEIVWHFNSNVGRPEEGPGTDESCGLPPGTLVAGSFDPNGNDPTGDTPGATTTTRDTDGDGIPDDEDPTPNTPGGGNPGGGDPSGGGNPSGGTDPTGGNPGGGTPPTSSNPNGDDDGDGVPNSSDTTFTPPTTQPGNNGNGNDAGCREDRNDPDGDSNGGRDEIGGGGGTVGQQDCNNGSGNEADGDDDNNGGGNGNGNGGGKNK
jgi:hypothetical protein